ncbi:helix-turn-helix transcriptional regulator [Paraburkholderia sp. BR10954]|uniref:helix-turn-helix transcriptional regulator n=1 Tax=Paraburkholderia sp. BR10954 TaxID=3236995 RepID=UPI0034D3626B
MPEATFRDVLRNFDALPDAAWVDVNVVAALYGCSVPTAWRRSRLGAIPRPRKFYGSTRWHVGTLRIALSPVIASDACAGSDRHAASAPVPPQGG